MEGKLWFGVIIIGVSLVDFEDEIQVTMQKVIILPNRFFPHFFTFKLVMLIS